MTQYRGIEDTYGNVWKETAHIGDICIDPMGDSHLLNDFYCIPSPQILPVPVGGEWWRPSYREEYYPIHMLGGNSYRPDLPDRAIMAMAMDATRQEEMSQCSAEAK